MSEQVVREALRWVGTPYRHQGRRLGVGCDCLGLIIGVWEAVTGARAADPGAYAADWAEAEGEERFLDAARLHFSEKPSGAEIAPGDMLLFRWRAHLPAKHAGIAVAADSFVHAYGGHAVTVSVLVPQWRRRLAGVFRFPGT